MKKLKAIAIFAIITFVYSLVFARYNITTSSEVSNANYSNYNDLSGAVFSIESEGKLSLENVSFSTNTASYGGAIYNQGTTIIKASSFNNNSGSVEGGVISSSSGEVIINFSLFSENSTNYRGGAIYTNISDNIMQITSSIFNSNKAGLDGGAIYNWDEMSISSSTFISNIASSKNETSGGAIYNEGRMSISSSTFISNIANSTEHDTEGGAIYNCRNLSISSSTFDSNKATAINYSSGEGGAIFNIGGTTTIYGETKFLNNCATNRGGAIYNCLGNLNLIADTSNIEFTGNTANGISNAIYDFNGKINLIAKDKANIIFNDRMTSGDNSSVLNINNSSTISPATGKIVLNENMSGYTGTVNLYGGEIELQAKTSGNNINTNKFFSGNINLTSGTLNILNNAIDNITVSNLTTSSDVNLKFDADLSNNTSDNFTVTNGVHGELNLTEINILGRTGNSGQITLFNNGKAPTLNILTTANYGGYEYTFTNSETSGVLNYLVTGYKTLKESLNAIEPAIRSYSLSEKETITEDLGDLGGTQLTVFGNGYEVDGNKKAGILISENQTLNIEKGIGENFVWENFKSTRNSGLFKNINGSLNIGSDIELNSNIAMLGGVIDSKNGRLEVANGVKFKNNTVDISFVTDGASRGGAISTEGDMINIGKDVEFYGNKAIDGNGGAIYNNGSSIVIGDNVLFENNSVSYNRGSYTGTYGGAILNNNGGNIIIGKNAKFISNSALLKEGSSSYGGAIYNEYNSNMTIGNNAIFSSNYAELGGAIYNSLNMYIEDNAIFSSNSAKLGGAIYQTDWSGGGLIIKNSNFNNNSAELGGAICNDGEITILSGTKFSSNTATTLGGAIYNDGVVYHSSSNDGTILNIIAETDDIEFTGNTANGISNAIYDRYGTINLWASENANIIFNDRIVSENENSWLYVNRSSGTIKTGGTIVINEDMSGYTGHVILCDGIIKLGERGKWFGSNNFTINTKSATVDMANSIIQEHNFHGISISADLKLNLIVDVDLKNKQMDTIEAARGSNFFENTGIHVKAINFLSDNNKNETTEILFTSSTVIKDKITSITTASSKLYKYNVLYNDGYFNFTNAGRNEPIINPILLESQVAGVIGGFTTQTNVLGQAFSSIDTQISNRKLAKKQGVLYASASSSIFDMENKIENGLWIRPYAVQETVKFSEIDVDNTAVGTLAGLDLATGENSLVAFYLGYAGSNQKYEDIKVSQTGYIIGATGMIIKDNWYAGLTANINFNKAESESDYGTNSFDMNMYSVGAKAGYNYEINDKWILEPNLMLMYGTVSNQEYETTQGAKIDSQSNSNIIIEPQVKAKLGLTNGWQPYCLLGYVANIGDKGKVVADETEFEADKINGYVEYGTGINKDFINTPWSCYAQITGRSGGRNGFSGNLGIKYSF